MIWRLHSASDIWMLELPSSHRKPEPDACSRWPTLRMRTFSHESKYTRGNSKRMNGSFHSVYTLETEMPARFSHPKFYVLLRLNHTFDAWYLYFHIIYLISAQKKRKKFIHGVVFGFCLPRLRSICTPDRIHSARNEADPRTSFGL